MLTTWCMQACGLNSSEDYFSFQNLWYLREKCDTKKWDLNWERPLPRVLGYKRRSDIKEVDVMEFRVYLMMGLKQVSVTSKILGLAVGLFTSWSPAKSFELKSISIPQFLSLTCPWPLNFKMSHSWKRIETIPLELEDLRDHESLNDWKI